MTDAGRRGTGVFAGAWACRLAGLTAILVAAIIAGCGQPPVPPDIPDPTLSADLSFRCGDVVFGAAALAAPDGAETADTPEAAALRRYLRSGRPAVEDLPRAGYRVLRADADRVVFSTSASPLIAIDVRLEDGVWSAIGLGPCLPLLELPGDLRVASWQLAVGEPPPPPDTVEITAMVSDVECAGGQPAADRILPPVVIREPTRVLVVFATRPPPGGGPQACPAPPPTPVNVQIGGPLGLRELLDGGVFPPAGVWTPECCG